MNLTTTPQLATQRVGTLRRITPQLATLRRGLAHDDAGMSTAEYAVGTVGACTIGGLLVKIGQSQWFGDLIKGFIDSAADLLPFL